jgi:hypothetical protein
MPRLDSAGLERGADLVIEKVLVLNGPSFFAIEEQCFGSGESLIILPDHASSRTHHPL